MIRYCDVCNEEVKVTSTKRRNQPKVYCSRSHSAQAALKIEWPPVDDLILMIKEINFEGVGKSLGVAANSVRKHLRRNGVNPKDPIFRKLGGLEYQGKRVVEQAKGYPAVLWPEHPMASKNGYVFVHRAEAYEKYGDIPKGYHVHHKDGNTWNWAIDNLEVLDAATHNKVHGPSRRRRTTFRCGYCGIPKEVVLSAYKAHTNHYCSRNCYSKAISIVWPPIADVIKLVKETSIAAASRQLGAAPASLRRHLKRSGVALGTLQGRVKTTGVGKGSDG